MANIGIKSATDIENFFSSYNNHNWSEVFNYMADDCTWGASEKVLHGKDEIVNYWTNDHKAFKETLGKPTNIVFSDDTVYLQVKIHLEFIEDGVFFNQAYKKGMTLDFTCVDCYQLNSFNKISSGDVFIKFSK